MKFINVRVLLGIALFCFLAGVVVGRVWLTQIGR